MGGAKTRGEGREQTLRTFEIRLQVSRSCATLAFRVPSSGLWVTLAQGKTGGPLKSSMAIV